MSSLKYTYEDLIKAYFRTIHNHMKDFKTEKCKEYVSKYKKNFDEQKFKNALALELLILDDTIDDYDTTDDSYDD